MNYVKLALEFGIGFAVINLIIGGATWSGFLLLTTAIALYWGVRLGEKDAKL